MEEKKRKDVIPHYCTLPMLQPDHKTSNGKVTIPSDADVSFTRDWSKELKL